MPEVAQNQPAQPRGRARNWRTLLQALLWVGLPTLAGLLYFAVLATDLYESESKYTIQGADLRSVGGIDSLFGALASGGAVSEHDARTVQEYIMSRDVLRRLDQEEGFIAHYSDSALDLVRRIPPDATFEEAFEHYLDVVDIRYDTRSGVSTLRVKATTAADAQRFALAILRYAEQMVNDMSERARLDRMEFARREVVAGEGRLAQARYAILELQREGAEIDPKESASAVMSIRTQLDGELSNVRAELRQTESFMRPDSHQVQVLKQRIASLEEQIARENLKLVDPQSSSLSASIARFEPLVLEKEFAEKAYESALASLEIARTEAAQQHRYLTIVVNPSVPDQTTHPKRMLGILAVFALSAVAFGIFSLLIAAAREHARL
jgi:capsular polysaccharide transport system permease protein